MKIKSPIILLTLIVLLIGVFIPNTTVYADGEDEYEVNVEVTENPDTECYEVSVDVYNKGKDFSGSVEISRDDGYSDEGKSNYIQDVSLPEKNTKTIEFKIPEEKTSYNSGSPFSLKVIIRNSRNSIVYSKVFNNVLTKENYRMNVAVLSDSADKLSFLDCEGKNIWISTGEYNIKLNNLKADNIVSEIANNKFLIINDYDTSVLSTDAVNTIVSWVDNGGVLIIGTGDSVKTLSGFSSDFTGIKQSLGEGEGYLYPQIASEEFKFKVQHLENDSLYGGDFYVSGYGQVGFARMFGNGSVNTLNFNLADLKNQKDSSDDEATKNEEVINFVTNMYDSSRANSNYIMDQPDINLDNSSIVRMGNLMEKPANTRMGVMVPVILIYIAIIGPILYLILKKINKREKCWIIIPGVALLFTFLLFLISITFTVRGLKLKTLTLQKAGSDNVISLVTGYSPKADIWNVGLDAQYYTGYNLARWSYSGASVTFKKTADGLGAAYKPGSVFDEAAFAVYGKTNRAGFFDVKDDLASASIVNNTGKDFKYIIAYQYGTAYLMEGCENGKEVNVRDHLRVIQSSSDLSQVVYKEYDNGNYDKASDYAVLQTLYSIVCDSGSNMTNTTPIIIGVGKSENILSVKNGEEVSYTCVYMK